MLRTEHGGNFNFCSHMGHKHLSFHVSTTDAIPIMKRKAQIKQSDWPSCNHWKIIADSKAGFNYQIRQEHEPKENCCNAVKERGTWVLRQTIPMAVRSEVVWREESSVTQNKTKILKFKKWKEPNYWTGWTIRTQ